MVVWGLEGVPIFSRRSSEVEDKVVERKSWARGVVDTSMLQFE